MRFGVRLPNSGPFASPASLSEIARFAEQLGYDGVLTHDHLHWGTEDRYHFYAGSAEAADQAERLYDFYDPLLVGAHLAGVTTWIPYITTAVVLAWRHPVLLARQVSSLYALLGGRLVLGVTVGNVRTDFAAIGIPWEERGRVGVEHLRALRAALGMDGASDFEGRYVRFPEVVIEPRPRDLPLWYCATSDVGLRRAVRLADGWMPDAPPRYFRAKVPGLLEALEAAGRARNRFTVASVGTISIARQAESARETARRLLEIRSGEQWFKVHQMRDAFENAMVGSPEQVAEKVTEYDSAGVDFLGLGFVAHTLDDMREQMSLFAEQVAHGFQKAKTDVRRPVGGST